jgi:putative transposase
MRTVINAILYIASTGCQWRQLPKDFPPYSTVQGHFYAWSRGGIFASLNYTLLIALLMRTVGLQRNGSCFF